MAALALEYSDPTLEEAPNDAVDILTAIGSVPEIRSAMYAAGMTDDDVAEGRALLLATLAEPTGADPTVDDEGARNQRAAMAALDNWDEPNFMRFKAMFARRFPSACDYVFNNLAATRGKESVKGIALFLARINHLDNGTDPVRKDSKKEDKKAVAMLAKRGLDEAERKRLDDLVQVALGPTEAAVIVTPVVDPAIRRERLLALKLWNNEWGGTARAVIHKRAYLIRMGLATRRVSKKGESEPKPNDPTE